MSSYQSLIATAPALETLSDAPPLSAFAEPSVAFVDALSAELFAMPEARSYPELTALAFWMRRSSIVRLKESYLRRHAGQLSVARGTVLHFAPSNVDTIFVYSWFISLLCGNRNIVRLSTKASVQTELLVGAIGRVLSRPEHAEMARRSMVVRYAADPRITALLSAQCDTRVIWGAMPQWRRSGRCRYRRRLPRLRLPTNSRLACSMQVAGWEHRSSSGRGGSMDSSMMPTGLTRWPALPRA
ncbi:hypothetical protein B0X78_01635 [bacterium AM6]|nr:hypothetical protein B0X78_01635 [bacterium AM6]